MGVVLVAARCTVTLRSHGRAVGSLLSDLLGSPEAGGGEYLVEEASGGREMPSFYFLACERE